MRTVLHLPFPPSVNGLYDGGHNTKRRFKSAKYRAWEQEAGYALIGQKRQTHSGPVEVIYSFCAPDNRRRDVFNYEKATSDFLVTAGIITDDSLIYRGTVHWAIQPSGVIVSIVDIIFVSTTPSNK